MSKAAGTKFFMTESKNLTFSPLDGRYKRDLVWELSEEASLHFQLQVEGAWLEILGEEGLCPKLSSSEVAKILAGVTQEKIDVIERTTQHATRALVEAIAAEFKAAGKNDHARWVHVGLTSFDTVDTAQRLRLKSYVSKEFMPLLGELQKTLRKLAKTHAQQTQCGRTHGQWAVPTLFGLSFAEAHERLAKIATRLERDVSELAGKSSGAIGGYHASSLLFNEPLEIEKRFLAKLGLKSHYSSTQIVPPEDILSVAQSGFQAASVLAKLAEDLRHLARSEICEVQEGMAPGQVGSSTMPQKRNPWNFEHVCSLFKVLHSKLTLIELDLVTEHQRDLTNSASGRFYFEFFSTLHLMAKRLLKILPNIEVLPKKMEEHVTQAGSSIFAEAFYVLATKQGIPDAHSFVREASRESERSGKPLLEIAAAKKLVDSSLKIEQLREKILAGSRKKLSAIMSTWED
jgi:adenylosuccinate lyase